MPLLSLLGVFGGFQLPSVSANQEVSSWDGGELCGYISFLWLHHNIITNLVAQDNTHLQPPFLWERTFCLRSWKASVKVCPGLDSHLVAPLGHSVVVDCTQFLVVVGPRASVWVFFLLLVVITCWPEVPRSHHISCHVGFPQMATCFLTASQGKISPRQKLWFYIATSQNYVHVITQYLVCILLIGSKSHSLPRGGLTQLCEDQEVEGIGATLRICLPQWTAQPNPTCKVELMFHQYNCCTQRKKDVVPCFLFWEFVVVVVLSSVVQMVDMQEGAELEEWRENEQRWDKQKPGEMKVIPNPKTLPGWKILQLETAWHAARQIDHKQRLPVYGESLRYHCQQHKGSPFPQGHRYSL